MSFRELLCPAGIIVMIAGLIVHIVGIATCEWLVCEYNDKTYYFDLWNKTECVDKDITSVHPYEGEYPELTAVRSLALTCLGACLAAIAEAIVCCTVDEDRLKKIGSCAITLAFSSVEISSGIFCFGVKDGDYGDPEDKTPEKAEIEDGFRLGYSFYLCVVAGFVMAIGGGLLYLSKGMDNE